MRTTIDIPDSLFKEMKTCTVKRGETLKTFLLRAVKAELENEAAVSDCGRVQLPIILSKEGSYELSPGRLAAVLEEEDYEIFTGH